MASTHLKNIAIIGATGQIGHHITRELLNLNMSVTAITRPDSTSVFPTGVAVKKAAPDDHDGLVAALKGQDALVITLGVHSTPDTQTKYIDAAADADVEYILPNEFGSDTGNSQLNAAVPADGLKVQYREQIEARGKKWIAIVDGVWFGYYLNNPLSGIDIKNRKATFLSGGTQPTSLTTMPTAGMAAARVLALPKTAPAGQLSLSSYANSFVFVRSFALSQREIVDAIQRVTGTKDSDWTYADQDVDEYIATGWEKIKKGHYDGMRTLLLGNVFKPGMGGMFEGHQLDNKALGLPVEDLDSTVSKIVETVYGRGKASDY